MCVTLRHPQLSQNPCVPWNPTSSSQINCESSFQEPGSSLWNDTCTRKLKELSVWAPAPSPKEYICDKMLDVLPRKQSWDFLKKDGSPGTWTKYPRDSPRYCPTGKTGNVRIPLQQGIPWHCWYLGPNNALWWGCPMYCRKFSGIAGLYPLHTGIPPSSDN